MTATGNVNNNGLTFPPPNCAWVVRSAGFSNDIECQGVGCDVPLPDLTSLYTAAAFDDAMTLVFGNKTSVGYLCGIKEAIVERNVNITGYCCLDTPTSSVSWGKSVSVRMCLFLIGELNSTHAHEFVVFSLHFSP
jgi:hypothetical protein